MNGDAFEADAGVHGDGRAAIAGGEILIIFEDWGVGLVEDACMIFVEVLLWVL